MRSSLKPGGSTLRQCLQFVVCAIITVMVTVVCSAQQPDWTPTKGKLMTRWAHDVTPDNVWQEYPRPQMKRENWSNLNGLWDYAIVPADNDMPTSWDGKILVPFCVESSLSGVSEKVTPDQALWYRRNFTTAVPDTNHRLHLNFGAVDWHARVWLNGEFVGEHKGGYDAFTLDITNALLDGKQELVVRVTDPTNQGTQPRGKQVLQPGGIWYTAVTGIWQTVWLEEVPRTHVRSLRLVTDIDQSTLTVTVDSSLPGHIKFEVIGDSKVVDRAHGMSGKPVQLHIKEPGLWSPDDPYLYQLNVVMTDGNTVDSISSYFGMRKIEYRKDESGINRLFLNNTPLFQYGTLDQGWWPDGLYTAPSDAALRYDIEKTKKLGFNMARKHVKIEPARWYYWCDKIGLLVWQDMPSGDNYIHGDQPDITRSPESANGFERELKAMINSFLNHPSIVMWVPYNEGWGQWDTERICALIKQWDPTRLVNNTSGWTDRGVGDVHDIHRYPGPGMPRLEESRTAVLGEYGGLGLPIKNHTWQEEKNWGYRSYETSEELTDAYVELLRLLRPMIGRGLSAAVYTQTTDVEIEVNGLMTYDRAVIKMDETRIAEAARKLYLPPPITQVIIPTSQYKPQSWRYTTETPTDDWFASTFDDSNWMEAEGGFGTVGTPGAVVRTEWNTTQIFLRRSFNFSESVLDNLYLRIHHDEDVDVYLNGTKLLSRSGWLTDYVDLFLDSNALSVFRVGKNTLAVRCKQTEGGQFIDIGIVRITESVR